MSHPVWVRGLKRSLFEQINIFLESHPVWVRGLKRVYFFQSFIVYDVAPRVGAWIETGIKEIIAVESRSHPVWVRGLKLPCCQK